MKDISLHDEKRIYNIIWNACGDYDFEPAFVGLDVSGKPDFYMNNIIGLAYRHFPREELEGLFDMWRFSFRRDLLDGLTWLFLEEIIFNFEQNKRANLENLRKAFARNFLSDENQLHRNSLALKRNVLYNFYDLKANRILGLKTDRLGKRQEALFEKLLSFKYSNFADMKEFLASTYQDYFLFLSYNQEQRVRYYNLLSRLNFVNSSNLEYSMRSSDIKMDAYRPKNKLSRFIFDLTLFQRKNREKEIQEIFGTSIFSEKKLIEIESKYCKDGHDKLHLWYSKGEGVKNEFNKKYKNLSESKELQKRKNLEIYKQNINFFNREISNLTKKISRFLMESLGESSDYYKSGRLQKNLAWKSMVNNQSKIFVKKNLERTGGFKVDLLLDASASRMKYQTDIAIEAYIIAMSLFNCGIGVRVIAYNTIYDYTNLFILKDWQDYPDLEKILAYYPIGWNRDGLAYRGYLELLEEKSSSNYLALIMTDISPNDLKRYKDKLFGKSYDSEIAIKDTVKSMNMIRKKGVKIAGLITGEKSSSQKAKRIFNNNFVKFDDIKQLSNLMGRFIQKEIQNMK